MSKDNEKIKIILSWGALIFLSIGALLGMLDIINMGHVRHISTKSEVFFEYLNSMGYVLTCLFLALFACSLLCKSEKYLKLLWISARLIFGATLVFAGYLAFKDIYLIENSIVAILSLVFVLKINFVEKIFNLLECFIEIMSERGSKEY